VTLFISDFNILLAVRSAEGNFSSSRRTSLSYVSAEVSLDVPDTTSQGITLTKQKHHTVITEKLLENTQSGQLL